MPRFGVGVSAKCVRISGTDDLDTDAKFFSKTKCVFNIRPPWPVVIVEDEIVNGWNSRNRGELRDTTGGVFIDIDDECRQIAYR
jgi:hypothetical protein